MYNIDILIHQQMISRCASTCRTPCIHTRLVSAQGPLATTLFSGTVDQSYIPHAIAYIACLGPHKARCTAAENTTQIAVSVVVSSLDQSISF